MTDQPTPAAEDLQPLDDLLAATRGKPPARTLVHLESNRPA
jgi:hypothetical protein